tara:strand:+ start:920 stop:1531 length:612 start_codon:yes stop_codon:yes gene_type:complete
MNIENITTLELYSTVIWKSKYPQFEENKELFLSEIGSYLDENSVKGKIKSNINGYQSETDIHHLEKLNPLFNYICEMAMCSFHNLGIVDQCPVILGSWLNVNHNRGCVNLQHCHGGVLSGVFYLKIPENSGKLVFYNQGINELWEGYLHVKDYNKITTQLSLVEPFEGDLILFPSYLPHSVLPNKHDDERISISFNISTIPIE